MNSVPDTTSRPETGANIRRIRIRLGLSQHEAGALLKVGSDAFDRYERGLAEPGGPAGQLLKLLVLRPELLADLRGFEDRSDSFTPSPGLASLLLFWGKARPETPDILWHPLVYHGLDVAAAGHALVEERGLPHGLASAFGDRWSGILGYLLALHDIGKLSRPFQGLSETHWPEAVLGPHQPPAAGLRHDALGLTLLDRLLGTKAKRRHPLADWRPDDWEPALALLRPVVAHHGRPVSKADIKVFDPELEAGHDFLDLMTTLFDPDLPPPTEALTVLLPRVSWELAGLTVLADWIGSRQAWFPYHPNTIDPMRYWRDVALPQARQAVAAAGLASNRPNPVTGYRVLTGLEHPPSPIQHWAETVPLPQGPVLALIEDMTGSGKTEAALILAHRLIAGGRAHGLYLALPTMATANAMYRRLSKTYRRLFAIEATPSLALAHGAAALNSGFRDSVKALATSVRSDDRCDENEPGGDGAGASCAAWIADSRRKTFLADVGVGTIDQALLAVLPAKYQALRLLGLGRQVLVIDEAHAYDTYMGTELERLLEFQAALGGNAVVLSATLPQAKRQALAKAFAKGLGAPSPAPARADYPLATLVAADGMPENGMYETKCGTRPGLGRTLTVSRLDDVAQAVRRIAEAEAAGAAVAWVRNTVDDAFAAVEALAAAGVSATLFHARAAMGDRLDVESRIIARFGKDGDRAGRRGVLVATQVIEQSLDLDFDLMVSDLAPIDLLLQRAGRLWRHDHRGPRPVPGPQLLVLSPDPAAPVSAAWCRDALPGTAIIYRDHGVLWLTAETLFRQPAWNIPEDVRGLVEAVYRPGALEGVPEGLERIVLKADGENRGAGCLAAANLLTLADGYCDNHPGWAEDTRTPTRLGEETTTLRLAEFRQGAFQPWYPDDDPHQAWALSEVSVRARRAHATPTPREAVAAERARASWTRHDAEKLLVPLEPVAEGLWQGRITDKQGRVATFSYDRLMGLQFSKLFL